MQFSRKAPGRVRLVKAADHNCRGIGSTQQVLYTLNKRKIQPQYTTKYVWQVK